MIKSERDTYDQAVSLAASVLAGTDFDRHGADEIADKAMAVVREIRDRLRAYQEELEPDGFGDLAIGSEDGLHDSAHGAEFV